MLKLTPDEVVRILNATVTNSIGLDQLLEFPSVSIDSRTLSPGEAFFALSGPHFDGHDFVDAAFQKGAALAVISEDCARRWPKTSRPLIRVSDPLKALQQLAGYARTRWGGPLVAVTGSMGKTTTRDFIFTLLSRRFRVYQSGGNFNNEIGVPLSLLELEPVHEIAVLELGMNHAGEISRLAQISQPTAAVITNVAPVHLEFFSSLEDIARAKGEILEHLDAGAPFFFNSDDPNVRQLADSYQGPRVSFGLENPADFRVRQFSLRELQGMTFELETPEGTIRGETSLVGRHFLYNLVAASAVALTRGVKPQEVQQGFADLKPIGRRGQILSMGGITIWDDSYNSNPRAVESVLKTLRDVSGFRRKAVALGEMLELGESSAELHRDLGVSVHKADPALLVTVGRKALQIRQGAEEAGFPGERCHHFLDSDEAARFLKGWLQGEDLLLIKGSRGIRMEKIVEALREVHV